MWVYLRTEENVWTVGFFAPPDNKWITESDHPDPEIAAQRVHWLNGGAAKEGQSNDD